MSIDRYTFGPYSLDARERRFRRGNEDLRLRGKVFDTLHMLVANAGRLVRKDELLETVWADTSVEANNVDRCISELRRVLETDGGIIETVPRQGYRFNADVSGVENGSAVANAVAPGADYMPRPDTHFFTTHGGVRLAYAIGGEGPPLVRAIDWISHLEFEWRNPHARRWLTTIMRHNTLVRYDQRGSGLSDWNVDDFSLDRAVADLEELMDGLGLDKFALLGSCQGGAVATVYAARHPERVTRLILNGAFVSGWPRPDDIAAEQFQAMLAMIRHGWGQDNPAFRQMWTTLFMPDTDAADMGWMNELQRITASPENAVRMLSEFPKINIVDILPDVACPTLVLHTQNDAAVPIKEARLIASRVRGADLVELPGRNHQLRPTDSGWPAFESAFARFMAWDSASRSRC
jgi:pimeloyl-ACP methyl ester carboxylesterase/DNA-binding winged helix-turn-helix (wHTH) protein